MKVEPASFSFSVRFAKRVLAGLMACFLLAPLSVFAQTSTGAIEGTVTDNQGNVISGATVSIKQTATNLTRQATTNESGIYRFDLLPVGLYELRFEASGFQRKVLTDFELRLGQTARLDITLDVGQVTEEVLVEGRSALVEAATTTIGEVIENRRIVDLPLNGRNFLQLGLLTPGAVPNAEGGTTATYGTAGGGLGFSVGGGRDTWNNFTLDGITILEQIARTITMQPSVDVIQEFQVVHNTYSAEVGGTPGAQVNLATKSGTNKLHGTLFEFIRNDIFDARNFFDPAEKPGYKQNQFGGSIGGPIKTNRTFFFGNYEGLRVRQGLTSQTLLPTAAIRNGDLSGINPGTGLPFPTIIDPQTGNPFPGNRIPQGRIHPLSQALLDRIPLPNIPGASPGQNNHVNLDTKRVSVDQFTIRVDHKISDRNLLFSRFTFYDSTQFVPFTTNTVAFNPQAPPGFGDNQDDFSRNLAVGLTTILRPNLVNDLRVGYNRINNFRESVNIDLGFLDSLGIQRGAPTIQGGIPNISVPGFANLGDPDIFQPLNRLNNTFQINNAMAWTKGRHSIKFGAEYRLTFTEKDYDALSQGFFSFLDGVGSVSGSAWSDFLLNRPFLGIVGQGIVDSRTRFNYLGMYFNDEFRATRKLTLTYGARYDIAQPPRNRDGRVATFNPVTGNFVVKPVNGQLPPEVNSPIMQFFQTVFGTRFVTPEQDGLPDNITKTDWKNLGPRFGIVYDLFGTGKTILRTAYGIYTAPREMITAQDNLTQTAPYAFLTTEVDLARLGVPVPAASFEGAYLLGNSPPGGVAVNPDSIDGYVQQYTLDIQQQITQNIVVQAVYAGSTAVHINHFNVVNQALPNLPGQRRGFRPASGAGQFFGEADDIVGTYHSLTLRFEHRLNRGLSFNSFYTISKAIDTSSSTAETGGSATIAQDSYNQRAEKGLAAFDVRHRFVTSFIYELPIGRGHNFAGSGTLGRILEGWQIGGILTLQSGQPFTPQLLNGLSGTLAAVDRPDRIRDGNLPSDQREPDRWFDTEAFVFPPLFFDALGPYSIPGNAGRNILTGPGFSNFDFNTQKLIRLTEQQSLQFRWEVFNLTNHPNFNLPGRLFGTPNFGRISSAKNARLMQFSLRYSF
ncbi:MAG TPA: carboxypeptidase-like regulatory domain-containing protein [Blastocatellia bacterium]|nr:carboxypeptidase-like regulatory domain-containing protein [Blastocatellia bacterium]